MTKRLSFDIFIFGSSTLASKGVNQYNETLWQRVMPAGQFSPHANAYFFADGGATGAVDPNDIVDIRAHYETFQFSSPSVQKHVYLAARGDQSNFANDRFIAVQTLGVEPRPNLLRTTSRNR